MQFDDGSIYFIEIVSYLLETYFACANPDGIINCYFEKRRSWPIEDVVNDLSHRMPWGVACAIYYTQVLGGDLSFVGKWETENGLSRPPEEVIEYLKKHWFRS